MGTRIPPVYPFLIAGSKRNHNLHHPALEQTSRGVDTSVSLPVYSSSTTSPTSLNVSYPSCGKVKKIVLNNGIRIILQEIPNSTYTSLNVWLNVGSVYEDESNAGVSHFLEHSFFKGTKTKTANEVAQIIDEIGGDLDNVNAFTEGEFTCFYANVLNEDLSKAIELFLDIIFNPKLSDSDIEVEKKVIAEEFSGLRDFIDAKRLVHRTALNGHSLGRAQLSETSLIKLTRSDVIDYLKKHYTPDNLVVSIAGDFKVDEVISQIEKLTSQINLQRSEMRCIPPIPVNSGIYVISVGSEQTNLVLATNGVSSLEDSRYALAVLNAALGGAWSSRLVQEIREKRGLAYKVFTSHENYAFGGIFYIQLGINGENLETVFDLILKELNEIKTNGLKEEELQRAKKKLKRNLLLSINSPEQAASNNALCELYYGRAIQDEEMISSIEKVTNEDIIKLAGKIFNPNDFAIIVVGPNEELSTELALQRLVDSYSKS